MGDSPSSPSQAYAYKVKMISYASSLYDGIEDNDMSQIKYLIEVKNANPNIIIPDKGMAPMHLLAGTQPENFALEVAKLFLLHGGDPNIRSSEGVTPVHVAAAWGQITLLRLFLMSGGDPSLLDDEESTPATYAIREQHWDAVELLSQASSTLLKFNGLNPIELSGQTEESNDEPQFSLHLEKVIVDEGEFVSEYVIENPVETKSTSTQTELSSSEETTLRAPIKLQQPEQNESWHRVAQWCQEQNQLLGHLSPKSELDQMSETSETYYTCQSNHHSYKSISTMLSSAISEVYKYTDKRYGIVLLEKRLLVSSGTSSTELSESEKKATLEVKKFPPQTVKGSGSCGRSTSEILSEKGYCTDALRRELEERGGVTGPITKTTKRVYMKQLVKLRKGNFAVHPVTLGTTRFSRELEKSLKNLKSLSLTRGLELEQRMSDHFSKTPAGRKWREGMSKSSFTYLLLDPRVTCNLPLRATSMNPSERWEAFVRSVFYVGKGKRSRPYSHLYEAVEVWNKKSNKTNKKIDHILEIWKANHGVVCLHIFQNVIPVEAYTREAVMIDAIGLGNLCNQKRGEYYGVIASQSPDQRRELGVYLLYRAMHIFLHEGERQLQPLDIF